MNGAMSGREKVLEWLAEMEGAIAVIGGTFGVGLEGAKTLLGPIPVLCLMDNSKRFIIK